MVVRHYANGYANFTECMKKLDNVEEQIHVYFTGSKLPTGESWCGDCVRAQPIVEASLGKAQENSHFVCVEVGDRKIWNDMNCPFRKDRNTKLLVIPTLLRWKKHQRLEGEQCENRELLEMLFTDED